MFYHLFCINGKEVIFCKSFKKTITMLFLSRAFTLLNLFKVRVSCRLPCYSISLEEPLNCVCIKRNVFIQKNMYPIKIFVQISMRNCLLPDRFSFFLMFYLVCCTFSRKHNREACFGIKCLK